jgi:hypothetical protein
VTTRRHAPERTTRPWSGWARVSAIMG